MPVSNEAADCTAFLDKLFNCLTPKHQSSFYYRTGNYDTCGQMRNNLWVCMHAKVKSDETKARKIIKEGVVVSNAKRRAGGDEGKG